MARKPLTDQEEQDLADIRAFNDGPGKQGWRLVDREIIARDFSGIRVQGAMLQDVSLDAVGLTGAEIVSSTFVKVDWEEADLSEATFVNVQFRECYFGGIDADGATFRGCVFEACRANNFSAVGATFVNCTFRRLKAEDLSFEDVTMKTVTFGEDSSLACCSFSKCQLNDLKFENCHIEEMMFTEATAKGLHFVNGTIFEAGVSASYLFDVVFNDEQLERVSFSESNLSELSLQNCSQVEGLCLVKSNAKGLILTGGTQSKGLSLIESEVDSLRIEKCDLEYLEAHGSDIIGENVIQGVTLGLCRISNSGFSGLLITRTTFDRLIQLDNVYFNGLQLKGVKYSKDLTGWGHGVRYENSDRLSI